MKLLGTDEGCYVQFPKNAPGVLLVDEFGNALVTNRPKIPMPYLKKYVIEDGQPVTGPDGKLLEGNPPPFDSFVVSTCDGYQNRVQGRRGQQQRVHWDGCKFVFLDDFGVLTLEQFQFIGLSHGFCDTYELCLQDMGDGTVKMGYRSKPTIPVGAGQMWTGDKNAVPAGWLLCEGQVLDKTQYPDLFAVWGYKWGGTGSTFNAPSPGGRYARFVDDGAGVDPNAGGRTNLFPGGNQGDNVGSYGKGTNSTATAYDFGVFLIVFAGCVNSA